MTDFDPSPTAAATPEALSQDALNEPYYPQLRTGLILTGTGTGGAYHAGVLRALHEAGVKVDIVGGHGIGVVGALFAAVDGAQRLWTDKGFWRSRAAQTLYPWRRGLRLVGWALALTVAIVFVPLMVTALGLIVYPVDFLLKMVGVGRTGGLLTSYLQFTQAAFAPDALPTWLPRLALLVLVFVVSVAVWSGWAGAGTRRVRGPLWWRIVRPPLSSVEATALCWRALGISSEVRRH